MSNLMSKIKIENTVYEIKDENARSKISALESKTNSLASGSPLSASSTEEMTDTSRIYVNTTDGHWYYYNGSGWVDGGIYQATEIDENIISYNHFDNNLKNSFNGVYELLTKDFETGYYNSDGSKELENDTLYKCICLDVQEGETYKLYASLYNNQPTYYIKNSNDEIIKSYQITASDNPYGSPQEVIINIPQDGVKLYVNVCRAPLEEGYLVKLKNYENKNTIDKKHLDSKLQSLINEKYSNVDITWIDGYYYTIKNDTEGKIRSIASGYKIGFLNVIPGEKYKIEGYSQFGYIPLVATISPLTIPPTEFSDNLSCHWKEYYPYPMQEGNNLVTLEIEIPEGVKYLILNNYNNSTSVKKCSGYSLNLDLSFLDVNPLYGKIISFTGDSICAGNGNGFVSGWAKIIGENNPNTTCHNYGVHGSTIAKRTDRTDSILERISTMDENSDYIIFQGGVNDAWVSIPLGEMTTGYNDTYDETTFAGALESCFRTAQLRWKGKKIGYIVTHKQPGADNHNFKAFMDLAKEICKKWSIPYIDLFNESCLNAYLNDINNEYFQIQEGATNGDRCHPNEKGHQVIAPKIESWLKTL